MIKLYRKDILVVSLHLEGKLRHSKSYYSASTENSILDAFTPAPQGQTNFYHYYIVEVPPKKPYIYVTKHPMWAKYFPSPGVSKEEERIWKLQDIAQKRYRKWLDLTTLELQSIPIVEQDEQSYLERYESDIADLKGGVLTDFNPQRIQAGDIIHIKQQGQHNLEFTNNNKYPPVMITSKQVDSSGAITFGFAGKIGGNMIDGTFTVIHRIIKTWSYSSRPSYIKPPLRP